jgi:hypothetical protein
MVTKFLLLPTNVLEILKKVIKPFKFLIYSNPFVFFTNIFFTFTKNNQTSIDFSTFFFKNFLTYNYLVGCWDFKNLNSTQGPTNNKTRKDPININICDLKIPNLTLFKSINWFNLSILYTNVLYKSFFSDIKIIIYKSFSFSWYYLTGFIFILFIDACLTDDEPL